MNHECLPRDKERFEIQMKTQNLVGQQLDLAKNLLAEKLTQEESLQVSFEHELERLKTGTVNLLFILPSIVFSFGGNKEQHPSECSGT